MALQTYFDALFYAANLTPAQMSIRRSWCRPKTASGACWPGGRGAQEIWATVYQLRLWPW